MARPLPKADADAAVQYVPRLVVGHKLLRIGLTIDGYGGPMNIVFGTEFFERQSGMSVDPTAIHQGVPSSR